MGKFHPLIVHLPIGILLLCAVFVFLSKIKRYDYLAKVIPLTLFLGALSAVTACVTGWFLSESGEYNEDLLLNHKWLSITTTAALFVLYFSKRYHERYIWLVLVACISLTGHYGGTLTHGEGYLFNEGKPKITEGGSDAHKLPDNIQEAWVYNDLIQPILKERCMSCHNETKKKGNLSMGDPTALLKGGKNGVVVVAGKADSSEMIKRILLDIDDKKHMSPKGKTQPTAEDIVLLKWWINTGLTFDKKVKEVAQTDDIKTLFAKYQTNASPKGNPYIPTTAVEKADEKLMDSVRKQGVLLMPVAPESNYLQANFVSIPKAGDRVVALLAPFAKQLIWLKLGNTQITDSAMTIIAKLPYLTRLSLENTAVTNKGLAQCTAALPQLQYLNLVGTKITSDGLTPLSNLPHLEQVFLFKTVINPNNLKVLQEKMPHTVFDTGGYIVPTWASDTVVFKKKIVK